MEKISITRGLTSLKTLDKRIKKAINEFKYVSISINGKVQDDFNAKENLQTVNDLITYRDNLKAAIAMSNAVTKVKIGKEKMTVATAIEKKVSIQYRVSLLRSLRAQLAETRSEVNDINYDVERRLDKLIEASVGSETKNAKSEIESITKPFLARHQATLEDPVNLETVIQKLDEELTAFIENVDVILSESNASTFIEV